MSIGFQALPFATYVPGSYVEYDGSRASNGSAIQPHDALLIGQKLSTGAAAVQTIYPIPSPAEAISLFGQHSQLAQMCAAYKSKDKLTPLWAVVPAVDDVGGTAATGKFVFTGPATETRELPLYVGGRRFVVAVVSGDTAATLETKALAAYALLNDTPCSSSADAGTGIDFTARHKGTIGNAILLGVALQAGERVPAGVTVTTTAMSGGATDPDYTGAVTAMGDEQYHTIAIGIQTSAEVTKIVTELEDRQSPTRQIDGVAFTAKQETKTNLDTYGDSFNSSTLCVPGYEASAICPLPWETAAQVAAINARQVQADPAINGIGASLANASAAPRGSRFKWADRNTLLQHGISTLKAGSDGRLQVDWLITTYKTNALSIPDNAFTDLYTVRLLSALRYSFNAWMGQRFANAKLADDGNEIPGQLIVTPSVGRSEALAWFLSMKDKGWVENFEQFSAELIVQRNTDNPNRLDFLLPPDLINNLVVTAAKMSFKR